MRVRPVPDPRRFGVAAQVNGDGWVSRLIEKPQEMSNNLAIVGFYYFKKAEELVSAIDEQVETGCPAGKANISWQMRSISCWTGFAHADKIRGYLAGCRDPGATAGDQPVSAAKWTGQQRRGAAKREGVVVIPPVYIHPPAEVSELIIGPVTSLGGLLSCSTLHYQQLDPGGGSGCGWGDPGEFAGRPAGCFETADRDGQRG